jgi:transcription-repair coupling factor (superfamily II helicase)
MNTLLSNYFQDIYFQLNNPDCIYPAEIFGLQGASKGFFAAGFLERFIRQQFGKKEINTNLVIVVPSEKDAMELEIDLKTSGIKNVRTFPWWGMIAYRSAPKGAIVFGQRSSVLCHLSQPSQNVTLEDAQVIILTQRSLMTPVPPPAYIKSLILKLELGSVIDTIKISEKLSELGYMRVPKVSVRGEYTLRGEVLDVFMPGEENAVRIQFDFDRIEKIRTFDPVTQSSISSLKNITIYPMKEIIWTDELVDRLRNKLEKDVLLNKSLNEIDNELLAQLYVNKVAEGEELFYPLLFDQQYSVLDYLNDDTVVMFFDFDRSKNSEDNIYKEYSGMYSKAKSEKPVPSPQQIIMDFEKILSSHRKSIYFRTIAKESLKEDSEHLIEINTEPSFSFMGNINYLKETIENLLNDNWRIQVYAESENQALRISELLKDFSDKEYLEIFPYAISSGFKIDDIKLFVIQENEIFGRRKKSPRSIKNAKSQVIDTFVELNPGDYVVHVNYGIGLFKGIERVKTRFTERDYIKLEYAEEEIIFIPIEQVNLVQRYIGNEGNNPHLDKIGTKTWENRKNKVQQAVEDIAQKLIDLYSRRKVARGFPFPKDTEYQIAFEAAFPYEDTDDQVTVTREIKQDMESSIPMDRLVCGDVGYGKTELAMRAAFKAIMGGKQVAFLVPTTILAEQHYETCLERFEKFPVRIAQLSRFVAKSEQKKILEKLAAGEIDILVGTHRIIQNDVKYKDLGLMIIDEEQRFGVKDKEMLKVMKNNIDCLTMSATPIPRTLHMSLLKIRDMSLLTTPPQNRQAIETVVDEFTDERVTQAIRREIERGGQVFYLHNRVESLQEIRRKVETLVPEVLVDVAHGQMTSTQLEEIFHRFKMGGFHVLIATTIIENGIDIPNVNTIIIDRADMYGVSQLYQLRGRVGRSDRQAYAYLLYPENKALSEVAMKRLQVISAFTELGSGFKIAMKDMEIRGAGNLLGRDQSGDVYSVGFDMYVRLLNEAVNRLALQKDYKEQTEVLMEMEYTGFIPDTYIINPQIKMEIYKKIAAVTDDAEFDAVLAELADRFGPIPEEVSSLLALAEIRIICRKLSIKSIKERQGEVAVEFQQVSNISIDKILKLIKDNPNSVRLNQKLPNVLFIKLGKIGLKEKSEFIREKLSQLA